LGHSAPKFLVNPYFIFRFISYILAIFIGTDLFNEKITFTEGDDSDLTNVEKKLDKGKQIATNSDLESDSEVIKENTDKSYANLSYKEKMLALMQSMMDHDAEMENWQEEEEKKGTENVITKEEMVDNLVENRIDDTKNIIELTKALNETNIKDENLSAENKRSLNEESEGLEENSFKEQQTSKKFRSEEDRYSSLNKRFIDNGEGSSETK